MLVTHDLAEAAHFADTLTLLKNGKVEQHGEMRDFLTNPYSDYVTSFIEAQKPPPALRQLT